MTPVAEEQVREALEALHRRSLVEQGKQPGYLHLALGGAGVCDRGAGGASSQQIQHGVWKDLISYGLEQAGAKEYVRQAQERMLVAPILMRLQVLSLRTDALEERLLRLLNQLRTWDQETQGYGPVNLIMLLRLQRGHLRGLDLSQLSLRGAYPARRGDARYQVLWGNVTDTTVDRNNACDLVGGHQSHGNVLGGRQLARRRAGMA